MVGWLVLEVGASSDFSTVIAGTQSEAGLGDTVVMEAVNTVNE